MRNCVKDSFKNHLGHKREEYSNIIFSDNDLKTLRDKIENKSKQTEKLLEKIEEWKNKMLYDTEELNQNLKAEISFLKKMCNNIDIKY